MIKDIKDCAYKLEEIYNTVVMVRVGGPYEAGILTGDQIDEIDSVTNELFDIADKLDDYISEIIDDYETGNAG